VTAAAPREGWLAIAGGLLVCAAAGWGVAIWGAAQIALVSRDGPALGMRNAVWADTTPIIAAAKAGRRADALEPARKLALAAPNDPAALRVYGMLLLANGQSVQGEAVMRRAGALGWSDLPTQIFWADVAHRAGDDDVAVLRADAAMRQVNGRDAAIADRMRAIEAAPGGANRIAARLATLPNWTDNYLNEVGPVSDEALTVRAALVAHALRSRMGIGPDVASNVEASLIGRIRPDLARQVWRSRPGVSRETVVAPFGDPDIDDDGRRSPFEWVYPGAAGLSVAAAPGGALRVTSQSPLPVEFATTTLTLSPGKWRALMRKSGTRALQLLRTKLTCLPGKQQIYFEFKPEVRRTGVEVNVPSDCAWQSLSMIIHQTGDGSKNIEAWPVELVQ